MSAESFDVRQLGAAVKEVSSSMTNVMRSEVRLAKVEIKDSVGKLTSRGLQVAVFGGIAALSILPFMAFLAIGLGKILGDNYWLSSLIVSAFFFLVGSLLAVRAYFKLKEVDYSIPETRSTLNGEAAIIQKSIHQLGEVSKTSVQGEKRGAA